MVNDSAKRKGKKYFFLTSLSDHKVLHSITSSSSSFFDFAPIFSLILLVFLTSNFWNLRNLIKQLFHLRLLDMRLVIANSVLRTSLGVQRWRSGESTRLPPIWPGFNSQIRRQMWVEFVGSLLCTKRFSLGTPVSPLLKNQNLT